MSSNPTFLALSVLPTLMLAAIVWIVLRFEIRRKGGIRRVLANNIFKNPRGWGTADGWFAWTLPVHAEFYYSYGRVSVRSYCRARLSTASRVPHDDTASSVRVHISRICRSHSWRSTVPADVFAGTASLRH